MSGTLRTQEFDCDALWWIRITPSRRMALSKFSGRGIRAATQIRPRVFVAGQLTAGTACFIWFSRFRTALSVAAVKHPGPSRQITGRVRRLLSRNRCGDNAQISWRLMRAHRKRLPWVPHGFRGCMEQTTIVRGLFPHGRTTRRPRNTYLDFTRNSGFVNRSNGLRRCLTIKFS